MKVYYVNSIDYDKGDTKESPIFSSKDKAIKYLEDNVFPKSCRVGQNGQEVSIRVSGNKYTADVERVVYNRDGSYYSVGAWSAFFEIVEEEVL